MAEPGVKPSLSHQAPLYVTWEISLRCNLECIHCYSASGPGSDTTNDLSTDAALQIIDQLADAGVVVLAFSGGEPMLRADVFRLMRHAVDRGLLVNIATNGHHVTEEHVGRLRDSGVRAVTVSLDGATPETHDAMRRRPGLFVRATRIIRKLADAGLRVGVSFTPTKINYHEGPAVVALARELGAAVVSLSEFVPSGRGTTDLALPPDVLRNVLEYWIGLQARGDPGLAILWHDCRVALLVSEADSKHYIGCGAGRTVARITHTGGLTPCVFLPTCVGNLQNEAFANLWSEAPLLLQLRTRDSLHAGNCASCRERLRCGGCRAAALATYGDLFRGDPHCWIVPDVPSSALTVEEVPGSARS